VGASRVSLDFRIPGLQGDTAFAGSELRWGIQVVLKATNHGIKPQGSFAPFRSHSRPSRWEFERDEATDIRNPNKEIPMIICSRIGLNYGARWDCRAILSEARPGLS